MNRVHLGSHTFAPPEEMKPESRYAGREAPNWLDEPWAKELAIAVVRHNEYGLKVTASTSTSRDRAQRLAKAIEELEAIVNPEARPNLAEVERKLELIVALFQQGGVRVIPDHRHDTIVGAFRRTLSILRRPAWHDEEWALRLVPIMMREWSFAPDEGGKSEAREANQCLMTLRELLSGRERPKPSTLRACLSPIRTKLRNDRIKLAADGADQTTMVMRGLIEGFRHLRDARD